MHSIIKLPYAYNALEPIIDAKTVEIHYTKHHQTYCDKLNAGLSGTEFEQYTLEDLLTHYPQLPDNLQWVVKNHGGWLYNHNIYRQTMTNKETTPSQNLETSISKSFGSRMNFEKEFKEKALSLFGSGRVWLEKEWNNLIISHYPNQENPLLYGKQAILGIDVWEHAYYLHYQNRRADYINGRRTLINRDIVDATLHN